MSRKIAIFPSGVGIIDTESTTTVRMNGEKPISVLPVTAANMRKHFKHLTGDPIEEIRKQIHEKQQNKK